jgi:predicted ATPase
MIESVTLGSFKSFASDTTLVLAPVTVLAGPNSGGKSSILQAILLLSQSAASRPTQEPVELNGHLASLGTFGEVVHRGGKGPITMGCRVSPVERLGALSVRLAATFESPPIPLSAAEIRVSFGAVPGIAAGQTGVRVTELAIKALSVESGEWGLQARRRRGPHPKVVFAGDAVGGDPVLGNADYRITVDGIWLDLSEGRGRHDEPADRAIVGLEMRGIVPSRIIYPFDRTARRLGAVLRRAVNLAGPQSADIGELRRDGQLRTQFVGFWKTRDVVTITARAALDLDDAITITQLIRGSSRQALRQLIAPYVARFRRRKNAPVAFERTPLPPYLEEAAAAITTTLSQTRHLGPLRAAPRLFHSLPTTGDPYSVGRNGEFTAAVLHRFAKSKVVHRVDGEEIKEHLDAAVNRWLKRMGVHAGARSEQYGKIGHLLTIEDESVPYLMDLTQVGVGVSQLLPVLVQLLIAPAKSTIVLEQPELHLHPAVQAKLADLLLACTRPGRQIVCETHSEYLVSRLRILVAKEEATYGSEVRAYFVDRFDGASRVREVEFGAGAEIRDWPPGFFDQGALDASELIKSSVPRAK